MLFSFVLGLFSCASVPVVESKDDALDPQESVSPVVAASVEEPAVSSYMNAIREVPDALPSSSDKSGLGAKKETRDISDDDEALLDTALELTETAQEYWMENDIDHAIESLDQAYALVLKVPAAPGLSQQKDDLRFLISKRIAEMYASRHVAVKGSHNEIPMVINDHVLREIQSFQTIERDFFLESYRRSGLYREEMVKALKQAGLPSELSWLPLIESGFKARALSRARAFGLWQFIPSTGYKFGLKRNDWIDERLDPAKATAAAIAYMTELHNMFGDWATVLAAYNCGEGAVGRVIREQKISYLDNFWDFYGHLPRETARYYPRFLATLAIIKDPAKYGFTLDQLEQPLSYETVNVDRPVHLNSVAEKIDVTLAELTKLNPELRRDATPDKPYLLRVPKGKGEILTAQLDKMPKWSAPKVEYVVHRVRRGETLNLIALRYRTSIQRILEANHMRKGNLLRIGQRLRIPSRSTT